MGERYYYYKKKVNIKKILKEFLLIYFLSVVFVLLLNTTFFQAFKVPSSSMEPEILKNTFIISNNFSYGPKIPLFGNKLFKGEINRGDIVLFYSKEYVNKPYIYRLLSSALYTFTFSMFDLSKYEKKDYPNVMIKRVIGKPGDVIEIKYKEGKEYIFINNILEKNLIPIKYILIDDDKNYIKLTDQTYVKKIIISESEYFVVGDNRIESFDSREWGSIKESQIIGKAVLAYWPFKNFKIISN